MTLDREQVQFDITEGDWRVTGTYAEADNIVVYHKGEHYRTVTVPGYKIWNVVAHFKHDIIPDLQDELATEGSR